MGVGCVEDWGGGEERRIGLIWGVRGWGVGKYYNCDGGDSSLFYVT